MITDELKGILYFWNQQKVITHNVDKYNFDKLKRYYKKRKKEYTFEEIIGAIKNYAKVLHDQKCYFFYRWTLVEFLGRENADKFYGENFVYENFLKNEHRQEKQSRPKAVYTVDSTQQVNSGGNNEILSV